MMYGSCYLHLQAALPREESAMLAAKIRQFRAAGILLREGTQIPVSRSRNAAARAAFFALIGQSV